MAAFDEAVSFEVFVARVESVVAETSGQRKKRARRRAIAQALGPVEQVRDTLLVLLERASEAGQDGHVDDVMRLLGRLAELDDADGESLDDDDNSDSAAQTFECRICYDDVAMHQSYGLLGCTHRYCQPCFVEYYQTKIKDAEVDSASLRCPFPGCSATPEPYLLEAVLPGDAYAKYLDFLALQGVRQDRAAVWCPNEQCREAIIVANPKEDRVDCPACSRSFCKQCQLIPWHQGETCDQAKQRTEPDAGLLDWMNDRGHKVKPCPNCKDAIEKNDGCNHMTGACQGLQFTRADTLEDARKIVPLPTPNPAAPGTGPLSHLSRPIVDAEVEAYARILARTNSDLIESLRAPEQPPAPQCSVC